MNDLLKKYKEKMFEISAMQLAVGTIYLDQDTIAPVKGDAYRNERLAYLSGELYSLTTSDEFYNLLKQLVECDDVDEQTKRIINWQIIDLDKQRCVPKEFYVEMTKNQMESGQAWQKAKQNDDYASFEPYLLKTIEYSKQLLKYREGKLKGYDIFLDDYEPGMTIEKYDAFFDQLKKGIVPLIKKINETKQIDDSFVYKHYPREKQEILMKKILEYIGFDFEAGVLLESEHPFTDSLSKYDNRITTHYYEDNLISSIFSVIHEAGHANYNYSVREDIAETFCFNNMSSGMHESQSRLFENYLGRNPHFWDKLFKDIKELFPEQLEGIDQEKYVKAINKAIPSLVRTEADELTYPLHIVIRYEIEKGIFDGSIDPKNLREVWNQKYKEYLQIDVPNDKEGILQDMHWGSGSFGYFPTYALGSGYAAQFVHAMSKDIDIDEALANDQFSKLKDWLREHIHQYGGLYSPLEQIKIATGEDFDPQYYVDYLVNKYTKLYNL
jgi:carboxypeptidase Taq